MRNEKAITSDPAIIVNLLADQFIIGLGSGPTWRLTAAPIVQRCREIWKYVAFPLGTLPKVLVKQQPHQVYNFVPKSTQKSAIHRFIHSGRAATSCSLLWIVKALGKGAEVLEPRGLAFVLNNKYLLPGNGGVYH